MKSLYDLTVSAVAECAEACYRDGLRGHALGLEVRRLAQEHNLSSAILAQGIRTGTRRARKSGTVSRVGLARLVSQLTSAISRESS